MQAYIRVLKQRARDSRYAVDEGAVAEAMLARARPRRLNAQRANARKHLAGLERQIKQFRVENRAAAAPARSVRRATARRANTRRAAARNLQRDTTARIFTFLDRRPHSTVGDLAKSLSLDLESVSTCLNQLAHAGDIKKHEHSYSTQRPDATSQTPATTPLGP